MVLKERYVWGVGHPLITGDRVTPFSFGCRVQPSLVI